MKSTKNVVYVVFDRVDAPKGAAIHIAAFARALAGAFSGVELVSVGESSALDAPSAGGEAGAAPASFSRGIQRIELPARGRNLITRVNDFRTNLARWWGGRKVDILHFRSIFEGYPLALHKSHVCEKLVYEMNGVPSIELKYHYPAIADDRELLRKLHQQEQVCIDAADLIVTVSEVGAEYLRTRGADAAKIRVIPNGVDLDVFRPAERCLGDGWAAGREVKLLYCGTLAAWQGVYRAIEALELLRKDHPATLTLLGPATESRRREIEHFCDHLAVLPFVQMLEPGDQQMVARVHREHDIALAPLLRNDRNVVQGCCPLKVLEAMAAGVPLIASDLPVVSALARHDQEAVLVKAGSAKGIKDGVLRLMSEPGLANRLARAGRECVEERFAWERAGDELVRAYRDLAIAKDQIAMFGEH